MRQQAARTPRQPPANFFSASDYSLDGFAEFCMELRLENGEPMRLEEYERTMLKDYFDGILETVIIVPKKNGKTTLLGALSLFHLENWPEAECVIGASSRDQARILFKQAAGLVRRSGLQERFDVKPGASAGGEIRFPGLRLGPVIRVMAADAGTGDGVIPTLALVDELHRHPNGDLYGVFRDGLGPRDGQIITISTAGATQDSPLGLMRAKAHQFPTFVRDDESKYNYASAEDFVLHEWCLNPGEDVDDMELVAKANPAPWQTVDALRRRHGSPSTTPWQWRRFACGIWTEGEEPWLDPAAWDDLVEEGLELEPLESVWVGVDIGVRHDSTGIAIVAERDGKLVVKARIMAPPARGSLPLQQVEDAIRGLCQEFTVLGVAFDPWSFRRSAELLSDEGITMVEFPQSPERMAEASANLFRLIESKQLVHDGDPGLRSHVLAGVTKETERGWRLQKDPKLTRPIDALIALAMAAQVSVGSSPFVLA